ncbi:CPBP family intramembrane metalloprotease [Subsaximicrobium wynnwilliamsii]|uniref:CPBP family intramembrane metalloprotease n=1 Tax=Subsaximicrobium wynnwilliamsii TaxID=291179 RepID=A0A5C6ZIG2_9FLAO|nr:CPBP family intramembrane glutamic endopeptidase [Subsaximicrobium wynnwilliamsii]TXD82979.1 CPBP family intramembrane metalloprotease [Subsaximicrobium wynnwilliamsii]TXD88701.1 CPBP family intramembrane metalloprotease [Subsaximicrobium wynnwilliamsii]TXE02794.1 CPBP family intramembrane metalloprotease [Subsaximicrobium wynnwilliamsii]
MFIAQAFKAKHDFWRYLVGSLIIFAAALVGQAPLTLAVIYRVWQDGGDLMNMNEGTIYSILDSNMLLFLLLLSFAVGFIGLFLAVKYVHNQTMTAVATSRPKLDWKRIWFAFLFWGIISSSLVLVDYFYLNPEAYVLNFEPQRFLILFVIAVALVPIQTSLEEYVFRGYLMQGFGMLAKNKWFPLLMTSVIFGTLHIANPEVGKLGYSLMVYYIGTGLFLGILTLMDEGTELALGFHAANNLFTALLVTSDWTAFQTHSILKDIAEPKLEFMDLVLPVFIIFPILLFIFSKVYKWTNWKEKLFGKVHEPPNEDYKIIGNNPTEYNSL